MKSVSIEVFGKVQGVWFRGSTVRKAKGLGITGFVCNQSDGSVYMEAHGSEEAIRQLSAWCAEGPPHARVDKITINDIAFASTNEFVIRR